VSRSEFLSLIHMEERTMKTSMAIVAAVMFFFGSLGSLEADSLDLTHFPGAIWEHTGGGSNPEFLHDGDPSTAWTSSYNSHSVGNIDLIATLTFPEPFHIDTIYVKMDLKASSRSFQAGGSDQGRRVEAELSYKTFGSADFLRVPHPDAYERHEVNGNDGESTIFWDRTLTIDLDSVEALRLRASVASYTNEANAADGSVSAYEYSTTGVPEPSSLTLAALGALGLLGISRWRRQRAA
jgi:MYXO-CTERM domain-containing protein